MKIYLVHGVTGEYEDRIEWIAKAFLHRNKAEEFAKLCTDYAEYMMEEVECSRGRKYRRHDIEEYNSPDEEFCIDYTGTSYFISEIEIEESNSADFSIPKDIS